IRRLGAPTRRAGSGTRASPSTTARCQTPWRVSDTNSHACSALALMLLLGLGLAFALTTHASSSLPLSTGLGTSSAFLLRWPPSTLIFHSLRLFSLTPLGISCSPCRFPSLALLASTLLRRFFFTPLGCRSRPPCLPSLRTGCLRSGSRS